MVIEIILALGLCRIHAGSVLVSRNILVAIPEADALGTGLLVAKALQIPLYLVIGQTDLEQHFPE